MCTVRVRLTHVSMFRACESRETTFERGQELREKRNALLVVVMFVAFGWAFWAWLLTGEADSSGDWVHRIAAPLIMLIAAGAFVWSIGFEDKLPDHLSDYAGGVYYEQAGLCFMPVIRKKNERAYIHIYYQNRFDSPVESIIHLRPPDNTMQHRPDAKDIHFAFICPGGGVGVIEQPVAVHPRLQGQTVDVELAAAVNYRHNRGHQLRSRKGLPCGTFEVDWGINFRTGMHELSGEIELLNPATVHLPIPRDVSNRIKSGEHWSHRILHVPEN